MASQPKVRPGDFPFSKSSTENAGFRSCTRLERKNLTFQLWVMSYELLQNLGCVYACLAIGYSPGIAYRNGNFSWGKWWLTDGLSYGFLAILFSISFSDTATLGCTSRIPPSSGHFGVEWPKPRYVLERSNQRIFLGRLKAEFCCWNPQQLFGELPWPGWRPTNRKTPSQNIFMIVGWHFDS